MKLLRYAIFMFLCSFIASCEKDDVMTEITEPDDRIEITDENIQGEWMLTYINGEKLNAETAFFNIVFLSEERGFIISENLNSSFENESEGIYSLTENEESEFVISGIYNFSYGESWSESYRINSLSPTMMVWTGMDSGNIYTFNRK